jgi:hypothetical protein
MLTKRRASQCQGRPRRASWLLVYYHLEQDGTELEGLGPAAYSRQKFP